MSIEFSDTVNNDGILQQARILTRVDANQWPTQRVVNSANNWKDFVAGYAIGADKRFRWDDTNHTKLPEGTTDLTINQTDYSFLTDEQGNAILTLTGIARIEDSKPIPLTSVDRSDPNYDLTTFGTSTGTPTEYDKIADNIIRLNNKPPATISGGIKFYFQRTPSYYTAASTTTTTGFSPLLDRGFIIASAYEIALTLGLQNFQALAVERQREEDRVAQYFSNRNEDEDAILTPAHFDNSPNVYF